MRLHAFSSLTNRRLPGQWSSQACGKTDLSVSLFRCVSRGISHEKRPLDISLRDKTMERKDVAGNGVPAMSSHYNSQLLHFPANGLCANPRSLQPYFELIPFKKADLLILASSALVLIADGRLTSTLMIQISTN